MTCPESPPSIPLPVTAIVPTRDAAAHLSTALATVAAARPAETIVIDGASTDDSIAIARRASGVRVLSQRSRGLAAARNEAISAATQPMIAFCDADDRWVEGGLDALHGALVAEPDALVAIGMVEPVALDGTESSEGQRARIGTRLAGFTPGAMLARREAFERIGPFDETLSIGADSDWFVRLVGQGLEPIRIDRVVLAKGMRGSSLSSDVAIYRRELLEVARRHIAARRRSR
ncbi:MAG: glycosyltransferase family 2 protein [Phycisphaerales bacterium]